MTTDSGLPTGTVTFFFSDLEGSTGLWEEYPKGMRAALARHDEILRTAVAANGGTVIKTTGDGVHAAFPAARSALNAALATQKAVATEPWPSIAPDALRVRIGIHTGEAEERDGDYYGSSVNRAARIMALGHGSQVLLSAVTASLLESELPPQASLRNLGEHPLRGLRDSERIYQLVAPGLRSEFPPLRSGWALAGNLPARVSSFVGRGREMAEVRSALRRTRLLTLTGPGGTGKTRLSLQVAADVQAEYEHGAWIVELAPVTDTALVVPAVAAEFELSGQTNQETREVLVDYLREKELLLIFDNCEHLIEACAQLAADLLATCPHLTLLASSREGLGVYGETTYHLPTLSLPAADGVTAAIAAQSEAVQLFVERATAAQAGFNLNDANAPVVAQVVRRLDGIPLAIELAAARLRVFTIEQVAARLDDRFRLLTGGSRTALPRQQTLRALIDWSYDLLDEEERDLFRRLSVFWGGWTFDAAESVGNPLDIYSLLPQLISKSLVTREADAAPEPRSGSDNSEPRYFYLETIRQYARERLIESGQVEDALDRHFAYYESLATGFGFGPGTAILQGGQIILEQDNLRSAVEWGINRYPQRVLEMIWNLVPLLSEQLPGSQTIGWIAAALQKLETLSPATGEAALRHEQSRFKGLVAISLLKMFIGQLDEAGRMAREVGEQLGRSKANPFLRAVALFVSAQSGFLLEDPAREEDLAESVALLRAQADHPIGQQMLSIALVLSSEAAARNGDKVMARHYFDESMTLSASTPGEFSSWAEYNRLIMLREIETDPEVLRAQHDRAVSLLRQSRSRRMAALIESDWGHRMRRMGNIEEASAIYRHVLVDWRELGHRAAMANVLENMAFVARSQGKLVRAATLLGAAERIREEIGQDMLRPEREEYERELAALKRDLAAPELGELWAHGRALSTDSLIALALSIEASPGEA